MMKYKSSCFHCKKEVAYSYYKDDKGDDYIQIKQWINGVNYFLIFHIDCFQEVAGKGYMPYLMRS